MNVGETARALSFLSPEEKAELASLIQSDPLEWRPQPGPQTAAYYSEADVIGFGGAAGGGKSSLGCGLALTKHKRSAIFRREATQLTGVIDEIQRIRGGRDGYNGQDRIWRLPERQIEFGSCPHPGDEVRHQGRAKDLLVIDEATNFLESQVRFLMGWVRSTEPGQKCTTLMTFNPPTDPEGRWVIKYFAPWLDDKHPNPATPGELRWFATIEGEDFELDDARDFIMQDGERVYDFDPGAHSPNAIIHPQSRTFVPSRLSDNAFLANTGYMRTLQALPEPLRSQMLNGDFQAGMEDDAYQVIPTAWVDAAQARWHEKDIKGAMDSMGVDVARGGKDHTVIARRHGNWFDKLIDLPGTETPDGAKCGAPIMEFRRDKAPVHLDTTGGWGTSPYDFLIQNEIQAVPVNFATKTSAKSQDAARHGFLNKRAELWWRMREALDPNSPEPIALPPDSALKADLCSARYLFQRAGYQIEDKDEIRKRIGRSPDRADAVILALMATPKRDERSESSSVVRVGSWMA